MTVLWNLLLNILKTFKPLEQYRCGILMKSVCVWPSSRHLLFHHTCCSPVVGAHPAQHLGARGAGPAALGWCMESCSSSFPCQRTMLWITERAELMLIFPWSASWSCKLIQCHAQFLLLQWLFWAREVWGNGCPGGAQCSNVYKWNW